MSFDSTKSFEVDNGIILSESGPGVFSGTGSPVGNTAPLWSRWYRDNGEVWTKFGAGDNDWRREGKGKSLSGSWTNGNSAPYLTKTGAAYSLAAHVAWPGSDSFGDITSARVLVAVKTAGKAAAIQIYDQTNAQVIFELTSFSNADFESLDLGTLVNTPSTGVADWEIRMKRVDAGAEGRLASILILN